MSFGEIRYNGVPMLLKREIEKGGVGPNQKGLWTIKRAWEIVKTAFFRYSSILVIPIPPFSKNNLLKKEKLILIYRMPPGSVEY